MNVNLENHPARSSGLGPGGKSCEEDDAMASSGRPEQCKLGASGVHSGGMHTVAQQQ